MDEQTPEPNPEQPISTIPPEQTVTPSIIIPTQPVVTQVQEPQVTTSSDSSPSEPLDNSQVNNAVPMPAEDTEPIYTGSGGANIGKSALFSQRASWPLAKITIWQDNLEVSIRRKKIKLNKTEINSIVTYKILFSKGIQIKHSNANLNPFVTFFSHDLDNVINIL